MRDERLAVVFGIVALTMSIIAMSADSIVVGLAAITDALIALAWKP